MADDTPAERRRFRSSERIDLFLAARGRCQECGVELDRGWHSDHVVPWSQGGPTQLANGQALCPPCNRKKGASMHLLQPIQLRAFQQRLVDAILDNTARGKQVTVAECAPGAGKTLGSQYAINELRRRNQVNTLAVFSPRRNLCGQYEMDWQRDAPKCPAPQMGQIVWSANETPLVPNDAWGYTSTYAALTSNPKLHLDWAEDHRGRFGLVADEAQFLGVDDQYGGGTRAAEVFKKMASYAGHTVVMTGTPVRSDRERILFGRYSDPDENRVIFLQPDVHSDYREGVTEGYLRPFHAELSDGELSYYWADGDRDLLKLSETDDGLLRFVMEPEIWQPLVDDTVERVRRTQQLDRNYCGLVACATQEHVTEVSRYLGQRHPTVRALIAKSNDGEEALRNLELFKEGGFDLLLTVRMAYIGYDHKPISTACILTSYRHWGHLLQLAARAMRVWDAHPVDQQSVYLIAPHDPRMQKFLLWLRDESKMGMKERGSGPPPPPGTPRLGWAESAHITETSAFGIDPSGDLQPAQLSQVRELARRYNLGAVPETGLWSFYQELQGMGAPSPTQAPPPPPAQGKTRREERGEWGQRCNKAVAQVVYRMGLESSDPRFRVEAQRLQIQLNDAQRVPNANHLTMQQWEERYAIIQRWLREGPP